MKPVRILVDSTVDLPERCRAQVRAVPLTVHFGDEELIDGVTIDRRRFYERLIESDVLPTTSQATPAAFVKEFEAVRQAGESAVVITISAELSGTYQSACIAAADYEDIYVVDSRSAAIGSGILAELALEWAADGMAAAELAAEICGGQRGALARSLRQSGADAAVQCDRHTYGAGCRSGRVLQERCLSAVNL